MNIKVFAVCVFAIVISVARQIGAHDRGNGNNRGNCDPILSEWSDYGECSVTCEGVGVQTRTRTEYEAKICDNKDVPCSIQFSGDFCLLQDYRVPWTQIGDRLLSAIDAQDCVQSCSQYDDCIVAGYNLGTGCGIFRRAADSYDPATVVSEYATPESTTKVFFRVEFFPDATLSNDDPCPIDA